MIKELHLVDSDCHQRLPQSDILESSHISHLFPSLLGQTTNVLPEKESRLRRSLF